MKTVAAFERVSEERFIDDWCEALGGAREEAAAIYRGLKLPRRATRGSAGYDFFAPAAFTLAPGAELRIPTGIRVRIDEGWLLALFPRSGLGFRYRLQLNNTVGIIDSDYYEADNEGHISIKLTNDSREGKTLTVSQGEGFAQGVLLPFGLAEGDEADGQRHGGFGSTTR